MDYFNDMSDIQGMQYSRCVLKIINAFRFFKDESQDISLEIEYLIEPMIEDFKRTCNDLVTAKIPAIIYKGEQKNLPEIFTRINTKGVKLSKYQILAATWSHINYKIESIELQDINIHVENTLLIYLLMMIHLS